VGLQLVEFVLCETAIGRVCVVLCGTAIDTSNEMVTDVIVRQWKARTTDVIMSDSARQERRETSAL